MRGGGSNVTHKHACACKHSTRMETVNSDDHTFTGAEEKFTSSGKSSKALAPIARTGMINFSLSVTHTNSCS